MFLKENADVKASVKCDVCGFEYEIGFGDTRNFLDWTGWQRTPLYFGPHQGAEKISFSDACDECQRVLTDVVKAAILTRKLIGNYPPAIGDSDFIKRPHLETFTVSRLKSSPQSEELGRQQREFYFSDELRNGLSLVERPRPKFPDRLIEAEKLLWEQGDCARVQELLDSRPVSMSEELPDVDGEA